MNTISRDELKAKMDRRDSFRLVEALSPEQFQQWHLPGAINIPMGRVSALAPTLLPDQAQEIVVYCGGPECQASSQVARALTALGYRNVLVYHGGKEEWQASGYPVEQFAHSH